MRRRGGLVAIAFAVALVLAGARPATAGDGPVAHWSLDSAKATDDIGGNDGTSSGVSVTDGAPGVDGQALQFEPDGSVSIPRASDLEPETLTLSVWVKHQGGPGTYKYIVGKGTTCQAASYAIYTGGSGTGLTFYVSDGNGGAVLSPDVGPGVWDGAWHHVVGTYDGASVRTFLDGIEAGAGSPATLTIGYGLADDSLEFNAYTQVPPGTCGAAGAVPNVAGVALDDVTLWARALDAAEIADLPQGEAATTPTPTGALPSAAPPAVPVAHGNPDRSAISASLQNPGDISFSPADIARSALAAAALLLLIVFPSQLFNSTLEENYEEVQSWFAGLRAKLPGGPPGEQPLWDTWVGFAVFMALSAALYTFLSPGWGFDTSTFVGFAGILLGLVAVTLLFAFPVRRHHRATYGDPGHIHVAPATLAIAAACVILSRVAGFEPGYLYGLSAGFSFTQVLSKDEEGRLTFTSATWLLGFAVGAWLLRWPLESSVNGPGAGMVPLIMDSMLAAIFVGAVEGLVFGMIPLRFLAGEKVFGWDRMRWLAAAGAGTFLFVHVLLDPNSHYLVDTDTQSLHTTIALFVLFGAASVAFWAWFRVHPKVDAPAP